MSAADFIQPSPSAPSRFQQSPHWPQLLEERQLTEIALFESAMRRGDLRGLPTCFSDASELVELVELAA